MYVQEILVPHSSSLLLFASSAQTHIFPEIRIDAIRFLDLLLERLPEVLVDGWTEGGKSHGGRILEGYLGLLGTTNESDEPQGTLFFRNRAQCKFIISRLDQGRFDC